MCSRHSSCHRHNTGQVCQEKARHGTAWQGTSGQGTAGHSRAGHSRAQQGTAQHSTAQHSRAGQGPARHSTAQHRTDSRLSAAETGHLEVLHSAVANAWPHAFAALAQQRRQTICEWKCPGHPGRSSRDPAQTLVGYTGQSQRCLGSEGLLESGLAPAVPLHTKVVSSLLTTELRAVMRRGRKGEALPN